MALFSRKQNTKATKKTAAPKAEAVATQSPVSQGKGTLSHVLTHARITEKASWVAANGVYVFDISERATKRDIISAVKELYNVSPRKVAVVTVKSKTRRNARTGKLGTKKGGRKAYVYLKSGDTIAIA